MGHERPEVARGLCYNSCIYDQRILQRLDNIWFLECTNSLRVCVVVFLIKNLCQSCAKPNYKKLQNQFGTPSFTLFVAEGLGIIDNDFFVKFGFVYYW